MKYTLYFESGFMFTCIEFPGQSELNAIMCSDFEYKEDTGVVTVWADENHNILSGIFKMKDIRAIITNTHKNANSNGDITEGPKSY